MRKWVLAHMSVATGDHIRVYLDLRVRLVLSISGVYANTQGKGHYPMLNGDTKQLARRFQAILTEELGWPVARTFILCGLARHHSFTICARSNHEILAAQLSARRGSGALNLNTNTPFPLQPIFKGQKQ